MHSRAHHEGADEREGEGEDGEQDRPGLQRVALLHHDRGMQERGGQQPRHEADVLDRIPEPPAAPAEFVVGPDAAQRDADGQEHPGEQRPGPHPARPGGIDPAFDQRGDGEGKGHRETDIAEIEEGRVEGEARVLQQRIEIVAVEGRVDETRERVRGEQEEAEEGRGDGGLDRQDPGAQGRRQVAAPPGDHGAEKRQDQHPEQHRALVVAPGSGDLVEHRFERVRIGGHQPDREVRDDEGVHQREKGRQRQGELDRRRRDRDAHPVGPAARRADHRHDGLDQGDNQGEDEGKVPQFDDHSPLRSLCSNHYGAKPRGIQFDRRRDLAISRPGEAARKMPDRGDARHRDIAVERGIPAEIDRSEGERGGEHCAERGEILPQIVRRDDGVDRAVRRETKVDAGCRERMTGRSCHAPAGCSG